MFDFLTESDSEIGESLPDSLQEMAEVAAGCRACPLWESATQTVFGEGPQTAKIVLVGEQPGDYEDQQGKPFVGPAGKLLDQCLEQAGMVRSDLYVTNAVKHFKWVASGPRRLHQKPTRKEVKACHPWLEAELNLIRPTLIVCLGATAAQALLGADFRLTQHRGEFIPLPNGTAVLSTIHPSAILRMPDEAAKEQEKSNLIADLRLAQGRVSGVQA